MDSRKFRDNATGRLVPIWDGDWAFIPDPLPPRWDFPPSLWPLLAEAKTKVALLEGVGRSLPNPAILLQPLARREAIQSSRIEGTYTTAKDLLLFEMAPRAATPDEAQVADQQEVFNYQRALDHAIHSSLPLSLRLIREMHSILLSGVRGKDKTPGEFRRVPVAIGANRRFIPPPPDQVGPCLDNLEKYLHGAETSVDPLVQCFLAHYQFETIHPFVDGNGRVGRLLLAVMIQHQCQLTKTWLYLSDFFEQYREEYYEKLFTISASGQWTEWIEFCLRGTSAQAEATVMRCERLRALREDYLQRLANVRGNTRLNAIVEGLFSSPLVRVTDLRDRLQVSYPTAKADLERLVRSGILRELPHAASRTFYAPDIYRAAYGDIDRLEA